MAFDEFQRTLKEECIVMDGPSTGVAAITPYWSQSPLQLPPVELLAQSSMPPSTSIADCLGTAPFGKVSLAIY